MNKVRLVSPCGPECEAGATVLNLVEKGEAVSLRTGMSCSACARGLICYRSDSPREALFDVEAYMVVPLWQQWLKRFLGL